MFRILFAATAALITFATPALAEDRSFTQDGVTYVFTVTEGKDGTIYQGTTSDGRRFHLVEHNGQVHGDTDGMPVSFRVHTSARVTVARR